MLAERLRPSSVPGYHQELFAVSPKTPIFNDSKSHLKLLSKPIEQCRMNVIQICVVEIGISDHYGAKQEGREPTNFRGVDGGIRPL